MPWERTELESSASNESGITHAVLPHVLAVYKKNTLATKESVGVVTTQTVRKPCNVTQHTAPRLNITNKRTSVKSKVIPWDTETVAKIALNYYKTQYDDVETDELYSNGDGDYSRLEPSEIEAFTKAISELSFENKTKINSPYGNNMDIWRERNALSMLNKGNPYHCGSKAKDKDAMLAHCKCPLHMAFYLCVKHLYKHGEDNKFYKLCMKYNRK